MIPPLMKINTLIYLGVTMNKKELVDQHDQYEIIILLANLNEYKVIIGNNWGSVFPIKIVESSDDPRISEIEIELATKLAHAEVERMKKLKE